MDPDADDRPPHEPDDTWPYEDWGRPPEEDQPTATTNATVLSVLALVVGFLVAAGLVLLSLATSLCGLFGETCTSAEGSRMGLASAGAVAVFLGVPGLVAWVRRDARWLLAPVLEAAAVAALGIVLALG